MSGRAFALAFAALAVGGCQTLPREAPAVSDGSPPAAAFAARERALGALDGWTLRGRGALNADGRGWNGSVHWAQCDGRSDLRFIAPLGAGTVRLTGDDHAMRVQATDGTDFVSGDLAADLEHWLGVGVPVATLRWWIVGLPAPGDRYERLELDAAGRPTALEQAGWRVSFPRYAAHAGHQVPAIVAGERDGARVRLAIERWEPGCR